MVKITIFTPIYNRATYLLSLYDCLHGQTYRNFEWIVVDDGSSDGCANVMSDILGQHDGTFSIRFFQKPNGGKHTAINMGVGKSEGELFLILDSDDSLPAKSLEFIVEQYQDIADNPSVCGVSGLMAHHDGTQIGTGYPVDGLVASSIELRYKYGVTGDLIEVFRTNVLRQFPFPEIKGERFCPEALVWNRIALKYKLKCFNQIVYYRDYLDGGLTDNIVKIRMKSPVASMVCYSELCKLPIPLAHKIKAAINYWRFRFCKKSNEQHTSIGFQWFWTAPIAFAMHINDKRIIGVR